MAYVGAAVNFTLQYLRNELVKEKKGSTKT